ncbi:MAG: LPP20 family lipoprotein [bacterium]
MRNKFLAIIFIICFTSIFVNAQDRPNWIDNPNSKYSDAAYLVAIGEGDNRKAAENNATSNLALIFKSDIKVDNSQIDRYNELMGDQEAFQHESNVTKKVNVSSKQTLFNVKFGESYTSNTGRVFVLAYIDKMETADIYNEKISTNTEKINFFITTASNTSDKIINYSALNAASLFSLDNEMLIEQLKIISPEFGNTEDLGYDHNDITKKSIDAAKEISFSVHILNDSDGKTTAFIKEFLSSKGFIINSNPILKIEGSVTYEKLDLGRPEKFVSWNLYLNMLDLEENTLFSTTAKGREGSVSYDAAISRCVNEIGKRIKSDFGKKLVTYFDNLVKK